MKNAYFKLSIEAIPYGPDGEPSGFDIPDPAQWQGGVINTRERAIELQAKLASNRPSDPDKDAMEMAITEVLKRCKCEANSCTTCTILSDSLTPPAKPIEPKNPLIHKLQGSKEYQIRRAGILNALENARLVSLNAGHMGTHGAIVRMIDLVSNEVFIKKDIEDGTTKKGDTE